MGCEKYEDLILFILCIVDIQLTTLRPTKCTILFPDILYYNIAWNTATCFDSKGIIIRESNQSNTAQNQQPLQKIGKCKKSKVKM
jgi:hypothetical protein